MAGNASANGTKIQISDCYKSKGQSWRGDVRAASPLKSLSTGECLDLSAFTKSTDARLWDCKNVSAQNFLIKPSGHKGTDSLSYPDKVQFDKGKEGRHRHPGRGEGATGRAQGPTGSTGRSPTSY
ncbi:RICIN domain-containing protein [Streptomyces wuyuanensis]|uniref:RICIN domain-containing protein n=1 Tax=Streptomyces wuyuanensis TaxID=1196353 RepID=UPI0034337DDB